VAYPMHAPNKLVSNIICFAFPDLSFKLRGYFNCVI